MVHPGSRHSLVALQLGQRLLSGAQDLFVADGANDQAMRVWLGDRR